MYTHICDNVIWTASKEELVKALDKLRITTMSNLLNKDVDTFETMTVQNVNKDTNGNDMTVPKKVARGSIWLILVFIDFCTYVHPKEGPNIN